MEKEMKLRALCLLKLLYERTDEDHPLSTMELIQLMKEEYDIHVYRTTLASDIEQLKQFGIDIYTIRSVQNRFFINDRLFDIPELKLLIDAVESSKLITEKKSRELAEKLTMLASRNQAVELKRNLCVEGRLKPANEQIYYIVDALNDAINRGKKIAFQYFQYDTQKRQQLRHNGEVYIFSPYTMVWNGDHYYVVGYSDKYKNVGSFRIDRIYRRPEILQDDAVPRPADFNEADYVRTMFRMYNQTPEKVQLICANETMDTIVDVFGLGVKTSSYTATAFVAEVEVAASHVFFSWVFGFGGKVRIGAPQTVKEAYAKMIQNAADGL